MDRSAIGTGSDDAIVIYLWGGVGSVGSNRHSPTSGQKLLTETVGKRVSAGVCVSLRFSVSAEFLLEATSGIG